VIVVSFSATKACHGNNHSSMATRLPAAPLDLALPPPWPAPHTRGPAAEPSNTSSRSSSVPHFRPCSTIPLAASTHQEELFTTRGT
jgi:hypothetical protein